MDACIFVSVRQFLPQQSQQLRLQNSVWQVQIQQCETVLRLCPFKMVDVTMSAAPKTGIDPAIFEHLQAKFDEESSVRDVRADMDCPSMLLPQLMQCLGTQRHPPKP